VSFRYSVAVRCACPEGQACPKLWRSDGTTWNPRHGSAALACRIPSSGGTWRLHWSGFESKAAARETGEAIGTLLGLAGTDTAIRARVGDMIRASGRSGLPDAAAVQHRLGLGQDPGAPGVTVAGWLESWLG
jgi:hypothetical protein